jgi:hypothetical protein
MINDFEVSFSWGPQFVGGFFVVWVMKAIQVFLQTCLNPEVSGQGGLNGFDWLNGFVLIITIISS